MESTIPIDRALSTPHEARKEIDCRHHGDRTGARWLHVGHRTAQHADRRKAELSLTDALIGGGEDHGRGTPDGRFVAGICADARS